MNAVSRTSSSRVRDYAFLGFSSFTETHGRFVFARFIRFYDRWTTFLFPRVVCEPFSPDVKTDDNAHPLDWINVVAGRPALIFWSTVGRELPKKTAITSPP
jgi:hypothetical protein